MKKTRAAGLATAATAVLVFVLSQAFDLTLDQALASHITTLISTLIALFMPPPTGGAAAIVESPKTGHPPADQPEVFEEAIQ